MSSLCIKCGHFLAQIWKVLVNIALTANDQNMHKAKCKKKIDKNKRFRTKYLYSANIYCSVVWAADTSGLCTQWSSNYHISSLQVWMSPSGNAHGGIFPQYLESYHFYLIFRCYKHSLCLGAWHLPHALLYIFYYCDVWDKVYLVRFRMN